MIHILSTNDPARVVAVGEGAVVEVLAVGQLPTDWHTRALPNVLSAGQQGLAKAAAELAGLYLTNLAQAVQLHEREIQRAPLAPLPPRRGGAHVF